MTDGGEFVEPGSQLAKALGIRGWCRHGVKLVVEPLELFRLPEAREGVPLEALEDFSGPRGSTGYSTGCYGESSSLICFSEFLCELSAFYRLTLPCTFLFPSIKLQFGLC